ncbi:MAG: NfeD family protein [Lentisphaeria bacterium]|nr:NfeD family protein [Lentisphaeria bacterium]
MDRFWCWLIAGVILMMSEFVVPGFIIVFFGLGACLTGVLALLFPQLAFTWEIFIFAALSVILLFAFRRFMPGVFKGKNVPCNEDVDLDSVAGSTAAVVSDITPAEPGKVEFRGTLWNASAKESISAGENVKIISRENLTLIVEKM